MFCNYKTNQIYIFQSVHFDRKVKQYKHLNSHMYFSIFFKEYDFLVSCKKFVLWGGKSPLAYWYV